MEYKAQKWPSPPSPSTHLLGSPGCFDTGAVELICRHPHSEINRHVVVPVWNFEEAADIQAPALIAIDGCKYGLSSRNAIQKG